MCEVAVLYYFFSLMTKVSPILATGLAVSYGGLLVLNVIATSIKNAKIMKSLDALEKELKQKDAVRALNPHENN